MKSRVTYLLFVLAVLANCLLPVAYSQTVTPTFIGTTGNSGTVSGMHISYSVGEAVVPTFTVGPGPSVRALTQGFQQPEPKAAIVLGGISASPSSTICQGNSTSLSASVTSFIPPVTYSWSPTAGLSNPAISNPVASPTITTTYTLIVTDGQPSSDTATIKITVLDPVVTVSVTPNDTICEGSSVTLSATVTGGLAPYTFVWGPGGQAGPSITVTPTSSTTYVSTVTDNFGCTDVATQSITVTPIPTTPGATASPGTVCEGTNTTLSLTATGGSGTYSWTGPNGFTSTAQNPIITPVTTSYAGTYSVTLSVNGCPSTASTVSVSVNPSPSAPSPVTSNSPVCAGSTLSLTASSTGVAAFSWTGPNSFTDATQNPTIVSISTAGSGNYSVTATVGGCTGPAGTVSVTVNAPPTITLTPPVTICVGQNATFTAAGGTGYSWSSGGAAATEIITNPTLGTTILTVTVSNASCASTATTSVTVDPVPSPTVTANDSTLCSGDNALLTASGGSAYSWSTGGTNASINISPTISTNYTVTVSNGGSCSATAVLSISVTPTPVAAVSASDTSICIGDVTTLTASGGSVYVWNTGASVASIAVNPTAPTSYTVTVGASGCADTAMFTVNVAATPTANISGNATICSGTNATLTVSGGTTYAWNTGETNATITPLLTTQTTFTATAITGGCAGYSTFTVQVTPAPVASVTATPTSVCTGGTATLTASGGTTYAWNPGGSTSPVMVTPPLTTPATYTVTVSNGACTDTQSVTVNVTNFSVVIASTDPDSSICVGDNITLTATAGASYSWSTGETTQNIFITGASTNTYVVTVTTSGGCTGTDNMVVTVNSTPVASIVSSADSACLLSSITLTASGGSSYSWTGGPATAVYSPTLLVPGNNTYTVTVSNGSCASTATHVVFAKSLPTITANANPTGICAGDTVFLSATGGATYVWSTGALSASTFDTPLVSTTYTVVGTDANSCSNFATTSVTLNSITVDAGADVTICPGFTATLNAAITGSTSGVSFSWSPGQFLNDSTVQDPSATPDTSTLFIVNVTNGACSAKDSILVSTIRTPACVIHVYNGITPNGDNDNNTWFIDGIQSYPINKVVIFNRWGNKVWSAEGYNNKDIVWKGTDQQGNILADATYYYFIELYDGDGGTVFSQSSWVEVTH